MELPQIMHDIHTHIYIHIYILVYIAGVLKATQIYVAGAIPCYSVSIAKQCPFPCPKPWARGTLLGAWAYSAHSTSAAFATGTWASKIWEAWQLHYPPQLEQFLPPALTSPVQLYNIV